ncbi:biotin transporter BioY [Coleofasciculus sp. H7-2]|uniref:biotin transporter BioY n=1 Tax=Coleofasciculus sp. H7-2 TaxID=3351545 RepID=UPI003670D2F5
MFAPTELLWALIGLLLTIGGTFLEAYVPNLPWNWSGQGIQTHSLGVTYQIGAVLLVGCMGGKNAGALSQIAYLALGLTPWFPVFSQGGGLDYLTEPSFGYLLGFIPGAWICGLVAFKAPQRLESLSFSCICGLLVIHITGLTYLIVTHLLTLGAVLLPLWEAVLKYSVYPLPAQMAIVCAVTVLAYFLRQLMLY